MDEGLGLRHRQKVRYARLLQGIRELHAGGISLRIAVVERVRPALLCEAFALRPFVGWRRAVEAAGCAVAPAAPDLCRTVSCALCGVEASNLKSHLRRVHRMPVAAYRQHFPFRELCAEHIRGRNFTGRRVSAAGLLPHWEPAWSAAYVLDRLRRLYEVGEPLNPLAIKGVEPRLYWAVLRYFGAWDVALELVGVVPDAVRLARTRRRWTREEVVCVLERRRLAGEPMHFCAVSRHDASLLHAAVRFFGSYDACLDAMGLNPRFIRRRREHLTADERRGEVVLAIRQRLERGLPLHDNAMTRGPDRWRDTALYSRARRLFGSWRAARAAAGAADNCAAAAAGSAS